MQVIATGKWSRTEKQWKMLVAFRRPTTDASTRTQRDGARQISRKDRPLPRSTRSDS